MDLKDYTYDLGRVAVRDASGVRFFHPILPNRWQGEVNCLVGPFSSQSVAEYFRSAVIDFAQYSVAIPRIFANGDSWYIDMLEIKA